MFSRFMKPKSCSRSVNWPDSDKIRYFSLNTLFPFKKTVKRLFFGPYLHEDNVFVRPLGNRLLRASVSVFFIHPTGIFSDNLIFFAIFVICSEYICFARFNRWIHSVGVEIGSITCISSHHTFMIISKETVGNHSKKVPRKEPTEPANRFIPTQNY